MKASMLSVPRRFYIILIYLFVLNFLQGNLYSQTLTISSSGETGTSGTNWTSSGVTTVKITFTGTAAINPSVIEGFLNGGKDVIIESGSGGTGITISNNISAPSSTNKLIFNALGTITLAANVTTGGPEVYNGIVSISGARSVSAQKLWFNGTITGDDNITLNGSDGDIVVMGNIQTDGQFSATTSGSGNSFVIGNSLVSGIGSTIVANAGVTLNADTSFLPGVITTSNAAISITGNVQVAHFAAAASPLMFNSGNGQITITGTNSKVIDFTGTSLDYALLTANKAKGVIGSSVEISKYTLTGTGYLVYSYDTAGEDVFFAPYQITSADYLVVGAGGGGGGGTWGVTTGGGGGGGGVANGQVSLVAGDSKSITVGAGGSAGVKNNPATSGGNGGDSKLADIWSGGGGGGGGASSNGKNGIGGAGYAAGGGGGGRGGVGAVTSGSGGTGTQRNGGRGGVKPTGESAGGAGGGAVGNANQSAATYNGTGGSGYTSSITGTSTSYGKGADSYGRMTSIPPGTGGTSQYALSQTDGPGKGIDGAVIISYAVGNADNHISTEGLSVGYFSNTENVTINAATTISGPVLAYGNDITISANITTTGSGNQILLKAKRHNIITDSLATNGGDITIWSDEDADKTGGIRVDDNVSIDSRTNADRTAVTHTTGGGKITLAGGLDDAGAASGTGSLLSGLVSADGYPDGYAANSGSTATQSGIVLGTSTSATGHNSNINIFSGGGDIRLHGLVTNNTSSPGNGPTGLLFFHGYTINAGTSGDVVLLGNANLTSIRWAVGMDLAAWRNNSYSANGTLRTVNGNISLIGRASGGTSENIAVAIDGDGANRNIFAATGTGIITVNGLANGTGSRDVRLTNADLLAASGNISVIAEGSSGTLISSTYGNGLLLGQKASSFVTNSTSDVIIRTNALTVSKPIDFNTSGKITVEPFSNSFSSALSLSNVTLANTISEIRIGKASNTSNITIGSAATIAGPIKVYGGNININENLNTSAGNANGDVLLKATGNITLAASKSITTSGGDVIAWSDSDSSGTTTTAGGTIALLAASSITSAGGNIVLAGGHDKDADGIPDGYAVGAISTTAHGATNATAGLFLDAANLDAGTGNVILKGQGTGNGNNFQIGTRLYGGSIKGKDIQIGGKGSILGPSSSSWGLALEGFSIEGSGDISLLGWGGRSGSSNEDVNQAGVEIRPALDNASKHSQIKATGSGTISIDGIGGSGTFSNYTAPDYETAGSAGIRIQASQTNPILTANGNITLNGTSAYSGRGVGIMIASPISSTNGNIKFTGNSSTAGTLGLNGNVIIKGAVSTGGDLNIESPGAVTQTAPIKAGKLGLHGTGTFTLNNIANAVDTLAGGDNTTPLGSLSYTNDSTLTVGKVNPTGITATGAISIATLKGDLRVTEPIISSLSTGDAVLLYAEKDTAAENPGLGHIKLSSNGTVTIETGARALMYSGVDSLSTGLSTLVGSSNVRKVVDATTDLSALSNPVGNTGRYALYRYTEYVNSAPTNISLTPSSVNENAAIGTTVGTLSATDADTNDTFTFALVSGAGDTNNSSFTISGTTLRTAAVFDFETKKSYTIRVKVTDSGDSTFSKQFTVTINDLDNEDTDGDGFMDSEEKGSDPANPRDTDGDGTPDFKDTDSDNDGVPDSVEKTDGTDHLDKTKYKDSDGDLVPNHVEAQDSTDTTNSKKYKDSDGDGVPDYIENIDGTDPNDATDFKDTDGGGVPDYIETVLYPAYGLTATDPSKSSDDNKDTDGDGVSDYQEIKDGTDPNDQDKFKDTDGDGVPDAVEITDGTDPNDADKYKDSDGDHVPDYVEGNDGTDNTDTKKYKDSDGDGVPDYIENIDGTDPNDATDFKDADGGGVPDYVEEVLFPAYGLDATDPSKQSDDNQDTDGDGTTDYQEIKNGTNPNDAPSNLTYSPSSLISEQGKPIGNMTPSSQAGRVISYSISPSLPASLVFDTTTGKISGNRTAQISGSVQYTITAKNRGGSTTTRFTINYNTAPTNISLSKSNIYEKNRIGDAIGQLSSTDIDSPESHTYSLVVDGADSLDNKFFRISGNQLVARVVFEHNRKSSYTINVRTTDSKGLYFEKRFVITISELPEIYGSFSEAYTNVSVPGSNTRSKTPIISKGYTSQLEIVGSNIQSVSWSPATGLSSSTSLNPVFNHPTTVNYVVTITNTNGSVTQIPFTVEVRDDYTIKPTNIMSTRQDGINDYFVVENIQTYPDNEVTIFDGSGRALIKMSNYNNRWDGKINGKFLATGTYYYLIRFTSKPAIVHRGFITIINN